MYTPRPGTSGMWAASNSGDRTVFNDTSGQVFESLTLPPGNYVISGEATFRDADRDFSARLQLVVNGGTIAAGVIISWTRLTAEQFTNIH